MDTSFIDSVIARRQVKKKKKNTTLRNFHFGYAVKHASPAK